MGFEQSYKQQINSLSFMQLREDTRKFNPLPISEETAKSLLKEFYQE